ncbi:hypothetical protein LZ32DRAFT_603225 [Colletotrichum eremochloae]|nr:hypothetical protein LZ32DRAFT_603225 [Colletotrichum eremochloae]
MPLVDLHQTSGPDGARPPAISTAVVVSPLAAPPGSAVRFLFTMHCHRGSCGAVAPRKPSILR